MVESSTSSFHPSVRHDQEDKGSSPEWFSRQPQCDASLSYREMIKCRLFFWRALRHWRVQVLADALTAMQSPVSMYCFKCDKHAKHISGYSPKYNSVWLCANQFSNPWRFRQALIHELVHAFDFARAQIDPANVHHVTCTEIRAYSLSEQCGLRATWKENENDYETGPLKEALLRNHLRKVQTSQEKTISKNIQSKQQPPTVPEVTITNLANTVNSHLGNPQTNVSENGSTIPSLFTLNESVASSNDPNPVLKDSNLLRSKLASIGYHIKSISDRIGKPIAEFRRKIGSRDEQDQWKLQDTKRNRCLTHKTLQSLRDHELAKLNQRLAHNAITDVLERCLRDTWPFMGPPEKDGRWRPSRLYSTGGNKRKS